MSRKRPTLILTGLEESLACLPPVPPVHKPTVIANLVDVAALRSRLRLSQAEFADHIAVPLGTLRNWEQKRRAPSGSARVLLALLDHNPQIIALSLG